ncbi:MAG TPA: hypothetical protein PK020_19345 [Ilumatobacteraceae bacterium]|nr:hypothetical protein [Ilumatobacteraceae bacterium]HRB04864.1 hypothetical protein [Ilumatobacteraceae bacterium]
MDRRAVFFLIAAVLAGVLIPLVPDEPAHPGVQYVGPALVVGYLVLALLSYLDHTTRHRDQP